MKRTHVVTSDTIYLKSLGGHFADKNLLEISEQIHYPTVSTKLISVLKILKCCLWGSDTVYKMWSV